MPTEITLQDLEAVATRIGKQVAESEARQSTALSVAVTEIKAQVKEVATLAQGNDTEIKLLKQANLGRDKSVDDQGDELDRLKREGCSRGAECGLLLAAGAVRPIDAAATAGTVVRRYWTERTKHVTIGATSGAGILALLFKLAEVAQAWLLHAQHAAGAK